MNDVSDSTTSLILLLRVQPDRPCSLACFYRDRSLAKTHPSDEGEEARVLLRKPTDGINHSAIQQDKIGACGRHIFKACDLAHNPVIEPG